MRAGRAQTTLPLTDGELCIKCPACPHPGENLPRDWNNDPMKYAMASNPPTYFTYTHFIRQLHYVRFLAGDGNFKLQRLAKRTSSAAAPHSTKSLLGDGGFWVPDWVFQQYLSETSIAADEPKSQKKSACNTMAGDPGYTPDGAKALDVTGVFCVSCRHIFICPNGVVDFHKGEKYVPSLPTYSSLHTSDPFLGIAMWTYAFPGP